MSKVIPSNTQKRDYETLLVDIFKCKKSMNDTIWL